MDKENSVSYIYLIKWVLVSLTAAVIGSLVVHSFAFLICEITGFLHSFSIPIFLWTVAGALISGGIIYRIQPHAAGEGIPAYIRGIQLHDSELDFSVTFFKY